MHNQISRPALGQIATLGTFYDAKRDCFLDGSLFEAAVPKGSITQTPSNNIDIQFCHGESYASRCKAMNIGPDLAASLLSGLLQPEGLGHHIVAKNENRRRLQASVYHTVTSNVVRLDLASQDVRTCVKPTPLRTSEITHIVVEIHYGAQSVLMFNHWLRLDDYHEQEEARFQQRVEAFVKYASSSHVPSRPGEEFHQITAYSTTLGDEDLVLNDYVEAQNFLGLMPIQARIESGGKPILYRLLPIQMLTYLNLAQVEADAIQTVPSQECMTKFIDLCDEFQISRRPLEEYEVFAMKYNYCLPPDHLDDIVNRVRKIRHAEQEMKVEFARLLQQVRQGLTDPEKLSRLINEAQQGPQSPRTLSKFTEDYQGKVSFVDAMTAKSAIYVGYNNIDLRAQLAQRGNIDAYVFFFSEGARQEEDSWNSNVSTMFNLLENRTRKSFFAIVDCDADPNGATLERAVISHYQNGQLKVSDLQEEQQYLAHHSFARYQPETLETGDIQKPLERRFVKIPCPGFNCGGGNICDWKCLTCRAPLEYGYSDQYIYCDCGRSLYGNFDFKCNVETHGPGFERYDNSRLLAFLKSLDQSDYLNVLILGETGVGKSTFINAFVNYLYFNTLDEALNSEELNWVIPCSFATQTMDRSNVESDIIETKITVGTREDEKDGSRGASATQRTQVYPITVGGVTYRLIDTPGIGDTRGLEYDKSNMADILATVSSYNELHGILILLKSNNARLTAHFSFCVKELLMHLHRDATENVVFGFTNTRISNYMPGDTFGSLKSLLEERKDIGLALSTKVAYCFDSESFRYLAAAKNGVVLDNKPEFVSSWNKSSTEAERMLNYFRTRKPHPIKNTISLNATRNLIAELTKPMAEISQLIKTNITLTEEQVRMISSDRLTGDQLLTKLHPEKQLLRTTPLDKPRTVCKDTSCTEYTDDGAGNMLTDYPSPCHPICHLKGVSVDVQAHPQLIGCAAFRGNQDCQQCGHHWTMHLHILYELESYTTTVKDTGIEEQIKKHTSEMALKKTAIEARKKLMLEYQAEHKEIREAAAKFGLWMKANSILPYNDATLAYLEVLINDEQAKANAGGTANRKKVEQLKEDVRKHEELVAILKESMRQTGKAAPITQNEVQAMVNKLFNLKHFGKSLEHLKLGITQSHERTNRELPHRVKKSYVTRTFGIPGFTTTYMVQRSSQQKQHNQQLVQIRPTQMHSYQNSHSSQQHPRQHTNPGFASGTMRTQSQARPQPSQSAPMMMVPGAFSTDDVIGSPISLMAPTIPIPMGPELYSKSSFKPSVKKRSSLFSSMNIFK